MEMLPGSGPFGAVGSTGVGGASAAVVVLLDCGAISQFRDVLIGHVCAWLPAILAIDVDEGLEVVVVRKRGKRSSHCKLANSLYPAFKFGYCKD
jgi:hypothetical protein